MLYHTYRCVACGKSLPLSEPQSLLLGAPFQKEKVDLGEPDFEFSRLTPWPTCFLAASASPCSL